MTHAALGQLAQPAGASTFYRHAGNKMPRPMDCDQSETPTEPCNPNRLAHLPSFSPTGGRLAGWVSPLLTA